MSDKAGEEYWTKVWEQKPLPEPFKVSSFSVNNYPNKIFHKLFGEILSGDNKGKKLLEIGCGNSVFLPYMHQTFGFDVTGIDYSELGCSQAEAILKRDGVPGKVILADAFNPPEELLNSFDVVCSFGVAEHFTDTSDTLRNFARFLKPGGILLTVVPNFVGATGYLHKVLNRPVYDIHVPLSKKSLNTAIEKAGLTPFFNKYFVAVSFAITLEGKDGEKIPNFFIKKLFVKTIRYASKVIWLFENLIGTLPAGRLLSGGIMTAARK